MTDYRSLYQALEDFLLALGDDVTKKTLKFYFAFRRLEDGFTRDVRKVGHFGTGDLEIRLTSQAALEKAKPLLLASYEAT